MKEQKYLFANKHCICYRPVMDGLWWVWDYYAVDDSYSAYIFYPSFDEDTSDLIGYWKRANQPST